MKQFAIFISLLALLSISLFSSCGGDKEIEKLRKDKEERRKNEEDRWERLQALNGTYNGKLSGGMDCCSSIAIGQDGERIFADVVVDAIGSSWHSSARAFLVSNSSESAVFSTGKGITATCKYSSRTLIVSSTAGWIFEGKKQ